MQDITRLSLSQKIEISEYIKRDNLEVVNAKITAVNVKDSFYTRYGKRALDIVISLGALIVFFPLNLLIAIITYFDVGSPILFRQQRVGKNKKLFTIYKFRNMTNEKDVNGELLLPSERVTRWGRFARKTSLDELLNFVSVLNGSMSVIGPRPLLKYQAEMLNDRHKMIYAVRPGLECPTLKKVDHALSWQERLDNYVWYVENCSFLIDIKLCFRIVEVMFERKETERRSTATSNKGLLIGYAPDGSVIYTRTCPEKYVEEFCHSHGFDSLEEAILARGKMEV